ncbi:hypothetical protein B0H14DRAFT_1321409 [Mycena olivaceomarginata]|nr:hypothetical protein B0H14DRAFT_1321409 [Mycena olivaceomarginata]
MDQKLWVLLLQAALKKLPLEEIAPKFFSDPAIYRILNTEPTLLQWEQIGFPMFAKPQCPAPTAALGFDMQVSGSGMDEAIVSPTTHKRKRQAGEVETGGAKRPQVPRLSTSPMQPRDGGICGTAPASALPSTDTPTTGSTRVIPDLASIAALQRQYARCRSEAVSEPQYLVASDALISALMTANEALARENDTLRAENAGLRHCQSDRREFTPQAEQFEQQVVVESDDNTSSLDTIQSVGAPAAHDTDCTDENVREIVLPSGAENDNTRDTWSGILAQPQASPSARHDIEMTQGAATIEALQGSYTRNLTSLSDPISTSGSKIPPQLTDVKVEASDFGLLLNQAGNTIAPSTCVRLTQAHLDEIFPTNGEPEELLCCTACMGFQTHYTCPAGTQLEDLSAHVEQNHPELFELIISQTEGMNDEEVVQWFKQWDEL